jgi:sensor c-di-GMP phosphodiesterase-like protein
MNKLLIITITVVIALGIIGTTTMMALQASYATKQSKQAPSEKTTVRPERQTEQPSEASEDTTVRPERQSEFSPEQQEDNDIALKDEQIRDVQQEEDDNENTGGNEEEQVEIDKAPVVISGDKVFIVWFNDQNTPNNNSEVLFRSSADGGVTFTDKINLSNTTTADSVNAEIAADGNNVIITWWEHNATSEEPVVRASTDNGATFGPMLTLANNGTIGQATE